MAGRRYSLFWRNATRVLHVPRIVSFIVMGVLLGCVFSFLFPRGFTRHHPQLNPRISKSNLQVIPYSVSESPKGRIRILKSTIASLTVENAVLKKKMLDREKSLAEKAGPPGTVKNPRTNPLLRADESVNPRLSKMLRNISGDGELIVTLANSNVVTMLGAWHENVKRLSIPNYIVIALDEGIANYCESNGIHAYRRNPDESVDSVGRKGGNHQVSGLKFMILREFLQLGYSVLLSDVDVVYVRNPLEHLHRDCDVESMTDGHDNSTAYGFDDVSDDPAMGWSRYAHTMRIWVFNSGFFYVRPTAAAVELLDRVAARLAGNSQLWDQAVFNEELFYPSRPGYVGLHASRRAMDFFLFMNSKVLFGTVRKDGRLRALTPVTVHVNYHPDKLARMRAVVDFYVTRNARALDPFPDGDGSASSVTP